MAVHPVPKHLELKLRPIHGLVVAGSVVIAVLIAFAAFSFIVGTLAFLVKLVIVVGVLWLVGRRVVRHAHS